MKVSIEVRDGAARFNVAVRARSIARAVSLVEERYPGGKVGVRFPIDPKGFFVEDPAVRVGIVEAGQPKRIPVQLRVPELAEMSEAGKEVRR